MVKLEPIKLHSGWKLALLPSCAVRGKADPATFGDPDFLPAKVPGCVELDLFANGVCGDPYFAQNPYDYRFLEGKDFLYVTAFEADPGYDTLHFAGIDTVADVFLNGEKIGHTENQFLEYDFPVHLRSGENQLAVYIYSPVLYARRFPIPAFCSAGKFHFETLNVRKIASMYGWDIMPRFVSGGIFGEVTLLQKKRTAITTAGLFTLRIPETNAYADLRLSWSFETDDALLDGYRIEIDGVCGASRFHAGEDARFVSGVLTFRVERPLLWYPRNYGKPNLYDVTVTLLRDGAILDEVRFAFGIRTVRLERTSTTDQAGNGEFCFFVNRKKIFVLGTNWVPLDAFPCRYEERMPQALEELLDVGCNAVRVWGGGSYQPESFYDFCDRNGILVWQDFCMGCAVYPNDARMQEALREEATAIVRKLRNHSSIVLWAGDNECDEVSKWHRVATDPNENLLTRRVLAEVVRTEDLTRPYLPSSPYTDEEAYRTQKPLPEQHLWGPRDDFKGSFYRDDPCHFASEIGYHGCPSPASLERFISKEQLYPFLSPEGVANEDWICHASGVVKGMQGPYAYRIPLMRKQVRNLFGDSVPDTLADFAKASQISQAEALKFFIEHFRVAKWRRTGIIWWNLLDGWPQISDAVVDWYHFKKLAYHFIKRAQDPFLLALDEPENGVSRLVAVNDTEETVPFTYEITDLTAGRTLCRGNGSVAAQSAGTVREIAAAEDYRFLLITAKTPHGEVKNHFITQNRDLSYAQYLADLQKAGMDAFEGF